MKQQSEHGSVIFTPMKLLAPLLVVFAIVFSSCDPDVVYTPRPIGYFRIELPEKHYVNYDSTGVPYTMEIPDYSQMFHSSAPDAPETWRDLYFGEFKATLYLSYHEITSDSLFAELVNQSWELTEAHHEKSAAMKDSLILRPDDHVYGTVIELGGSAASLVQFYLTDSTKNFIRGSLYFYAVPNKDSLQPVLDYIEKDVYHIVETLKWKDTPKANVVTTDSPSGIINTKANPETQKFLDFINNPPPNAPGNGDGK